MLAAAKTALSGTSSAIWWLIDAFCPEEWNPRTAQDADWYALLRAAQALIETEQHVSVIPRNEAKFDRLRHRLAALLESKDALMKALRDRAEAGCALASLRDTRDGVGLKPGSALPDILWVPIPGTAEVRASGRYLGFDGFKLGEGLKEDPKFAQDNEKWPANAPAVDVAAFQLAAYPTTVAQFRPFVESDSYENPDYWTKAGWAWCKKRRGRRAPTLWDDPRWHLDNHPVAGVTWHEAVAYCRWLSKRLGHTVRLPTEGEWEWAARGPEARRWPWGDGWETGRCNTSEASIARTTAVGSYPAGTNWTRDYPEEGQGRAVHDLAGNVVEWCSTRWQERYPLPRVDEGCEDYLEGDSDRSLRGGSWGDDRSLARAAYRSRLINHLRYVLIGFRCYLAPSSL